MPVERELEKDLNYFRHESTGTNAFLHFSDYRVQVTVKPMGEINTTTKFWEMMRQCHLL